MIRATSLLLCAAGLTGCAYLGYDQTGGSAGNSTGTPYAGEPGSVFDAGAGPYRAVAPEPTYNLEPLAPMAPQISQAPLAPLQPNSPVPAAPVR